MNVPFVKNSLNYQDVLYANQFIIVLLIVRKKIGKIINIFVLKYN